MSTPFTNIAKKTLLTILLIAVYHTAYAKKSPGYIVTHELDTIYGEIDVPLLDITGNLINYESLCSMVFFKTDNQRFGKKYDPKDLKSFSFHYKGKSQYFYSANISLQSITNREKKKPRFLQALYNGNILFLKDIMQDAAYDNMHGGRISGRTYCDFYLFNNSAGLTKIEKTKKNDSVKDHLALYIPQREFLSQINADIELKDIPLILSNYEAWLSKTQSKIQ